jgi:hypothetical protein
VSHAGCTQADRGRRGVASPRGARLLDLLEHCDPSLLNVETGEAERLLDHRRISRVDAVSRRDGPHHPDRCARSRDPSDLGEDAAVRFGEAAEQRSPRERYEDVIGDRLEVRGQRLHGGDDEERIRYRASTFGRSCRCSHRRGIRIDADDEPVGLHSSRTEDGPSVPGAEVDRDAGGRRRADLHLSEADVDGLSAAQDPHAVHRTDSRVVRFHAKAESRVGRNRTIAGGPPGTRTPNLRIKSPLLCQIELEARWTIQRRAQLRRWPAALTVREGDRGDLNPQPPGPQPGALTN